MKENQKIANEINKDIESGVYSQYVYLGAILERIAHRLVLSCYVDNIYIRDHELSILKENGYIN